VSSLNPRRQLKPQTRDQLEDDWRARLENAFIQHRLASEDFQKALEEQARNLTLAPDGSHAVRVARQRESDTRKEYMRLLRLFSDLVMRDKIPEE
jgi:hypothetical protein